MQVGQFDASHLQDMKRGIELFNDRFYWECHEELEHHWLELRGDSCRLIFWAVIQVAAALVHYEMNNLSGVQGMLGKARDKIRKAKDACVASELLYRNLDWRHFCELVESAPLNGELEDYKEIAQFQFPSPAKWSF